MTGYQRCTQTVKPEDSSVINSHIILCIWIQPLMASCFVKLFCSDSPGAAAAVFLVFCCPWNRTCAESTCNLLKAVLKPQNKWWQAVGGQITLSPLHVRQWWHTACTPPGQNGNTWAIFVRIYSWHQMSEGLQKKNNIGPLSVEVFGFHIFFFYFITALLLHHFILLSFKDLESADYFLKT